MAIKGIMVNCKIKREDFVKHVGKYIERRVLPNLPEEGYLSEMLLVIGAELRHVFEAIQKADERNELAD